MEKCDYTLRFRAVEQDELMLLPPRKRRCAAFGIVEDDEVNVVHEYRVRRVLVSEFPTPNSRMTLEHDSDDESESSVPAHAASDIVPGINMHHHAIAAE